VRDRVAPANVRIAVGESKGVTSEDLLMIGVALFLAIDVLFLPWVDFTVGQYSTLTPATGNPTPYLGVLALIAAVAFIIDLLVERMTNIDLPRFGTGRARTRLVLVVVAVLSLLLKLVASLNHVHDLGIGCWLGILTALALLFLVERPEPTGTASRT
jgi:hypothetical protein